jgi:hypothetical protein
MQSWFRVTKITPTEAQFEELTQQGPHVFIRRGQTGQEPRDSVLLKKTEGTASTSIQSRITLLRNKGWQLDRPVLRPLPADAPPPPPPKPTRTDADEKFRTLLPSFVQAYTALGFDPRASFAEEAKQSTTRLHPNEAAQACLRLVASTFGVTWTFRTRTFDHEHGDALKVRDDRAWEFYVDPVNVLALARAKMNGRAQRVDDHEPRGESIVRLLSEIDGN